MSREEREGPRREEEREKQSVKICAICGLRFFPGNVSKNWYGARRGRIFCAAVGFSTTRSVFLHCARIFADALGAEVNALGFRQKRWDLEESAWFKRKARDF